MDRTAFVTELLKLADQLDSKGLKAEADELDAIVKDAQFGQMTFPSVENRERGYHLPEWRKRQIEQEKGAPEVAKKPDVFQPAPAIK